MPISPEGTVHYRLLTLGTAELHRVSSDGRPQEVLGSGKPLSVVVYLACAPGRSATRDHLIDLLWANLELDDARHALRQALWYLRKQLSKDAIESRGDDLVFAAPLVCDREQFLEAVSREDYEEAVDLYEGEFLPTFAAPGGANFEQWADVERYRLRNYFFQAADSLVRTWVSDGEYGRAQDLATKARDLDPTNEAAWRLVLEAALASGDHVTARVEAHALETHLEESGRSPEPATERLLELARDSEPARSDPTSGPELRPEMIGREEEFSVVLSAWRDARSGAVEHIHLDGAPGLGKTRMLEEAGVRLEAMGGQVVRVQATQAERSVPFSLASKLAEELAELPRSDEVSEGTAATLVGLSPSLTDRYAVDPSRERGSEAVRRRTIALSELVDATTEDEPIAVLVDDLHWADHESLDVLAGLLERVGRRFLLVTTARPVGDTRLDAENSEALHLEPLTADQTGAFLASLGSLPEEPWAEDFPARLHSSAGGSPLLLLETIRLGLDRNWLGLDDGGWICPDEEQLSEELGDGSAVRRRVETLSSHQRKLLLILCAAGGRSVSEGVLAQATGRSQDRVGRDLNAMERRGLTGYDSDGWTYGHNAIATAARDIAEPGELRSAHRSLAESLRGPDAAPDALRRAGRHLIKAGDEDELAAIFVHWVERVRQRGDRRKPRRLAEEMMGSLGNDELARRLAEGLPLRLRFGHGWPRTAATVAAALVGTVALGAAFVLRGSVPPDAVLVAHDPSDEESAAVVELPVRRSGWEQLAAIDLPVEGRPAEALREVRARGEILPRPGADEWALTRTVPDSGVLDVFLVDADRQERRLTYAAEDDVAAAWSPDGRYLLIKTCRWSPRCWRDLALIDLETGDVGQLTSGEGPEHSAAWSPDGSRVAYQIDRHVSDPSELTDSNGREARGRTDLCWITVDGTRRVCYPAVPAAETVGWADAGHLLILLADSAGGGLARLDLTSREVELVDRRATDARPSPDGQWVAAYRDVSGVAAGWFVYPQGRPDLAKRLNGTGRETQVSWKPAVSDRGHIETLEVIPPRTVARGVPLRLRARGRDARGNPVSPGVLSWQVLDSTVASVDSNGMLRVEGAADSVAVRASAGGWRSASAILPVEEARSSTVLQEDWSEGLQRRWVPFGDPKPTVTAWPDGGRAFWNRGDASFASGVYSRTTFETRSGIGIEAELSTPRSAPRAQQIQIGFDRWDDPQKVEQWDHRTGSNPGAGGVCLYRYPLGDGFEHVNRAKAADQPVELEPDVGSGESYRVRVQIFPDGTCGVAINGQPVMRTDVNGHLDRPIRAALSGKSVGTRMLVGQVRAWEGIPGDIDWADVDDDLAL